MNKGKELKTNLKENYDKEDRKILLKSRGANFFGQESKGVSQMRGNGNLFLYENELFFKQWVPKKNISIPIDKIHSVEVIKSHLLKTKAVPLLKVIFENEKSQNDSIAWFVRKLDKWISTINSLL